MPKFLFFMLACASGLALAGAGRVGWAEERSPTEAPVMNPGQRIYQQGNGQPGTACAACHGDNGAGESKAGFPRLAGLNADYQAKQMHDYRDGRRDNPTVFPILSALSEEQIQAVARYAASLRAPNNVTPPAAEIDRAQLSLGRQLAEQGNWERDIPACNACHGPGGKGVGAYFPALAAQQPRYLIGQINAWKFGSRRNDLIGLMKAVADRLNDEEIRAVAAYYGSLTP